MKFAIERLADCWDEMVALAEKHWKETQGYRHNQPFKPEFERYNSYAKAGWYLPFTARVDGKMVGYGGVYVVPSMHTQALTAQEDTWFLLPEYRKGWNAVKFFKFMEQACRDAGAEEITLTIPEGIGTGVICERLDYKRISVQYNKQLTGRQPSIS